MNFVLCSMMVAASAFLLAFPLTVTSSSIMSQDVYERSNDAPRAIVNECGGVMTLKLAEITSIDYTYYPLNARCIWTLIPEPGLTLSSMLLLIESQLYYTEGDGFIFYSLDNEGVLSETRINASHTGTTISFQTNHALLYFSASRASSSSYGFKVTVVGIPGDPGQTTSQHAMHFSSNACTESVNYPPFPAVVYPDNARASIVLQNEGIAQNNLTIPYLDTEQGADVLRVYSLAPYSVLENNTILEESYSGTYETGFEMTNSTHPRLLIFTSDGSASGRGFQLNWAY